MREQRLYDALKRIASYTPPEKLRRTAMKDYGLEGDEAIEFAYENVIHEAKNAIKGMRRPKPAPGPAAPTAQINPDSGAEGEEKP